MKVWITKYALTRGLFEIDAKVDGKYASGPDPAGNWKIFTREWTKTREEAVKVAEQMKTRRIASLRRSMKKLEEMKF